MAEKPAVKRILIVAGEASGSLLGADLMAEIQRQYSGSCGSNAPIEFVGVGGDAMLKNGLQPLFPLKDVAVMGLVEVLPKLLKIRHNLAKIATLLQQTHFDAVITIDAQDFSKRVAKLALKHQPKTPRIHYVCPKVWAWRAGRAKTYAALYNKLLTVLPFECAYFAKYGGHCTYVGHPVLERLADYVPQTIAVPHGHTVALMVGSRAQEIKRHWPLMKAVFARLQAENGGTRAIVPLVKAEDAALLGDIPTGMKVVVGAARYAALGTCRAAVSKSGTGNLELAVLGVPMVVGYKMNAVTYFLLTQVLGVNLPYYSLVNWVAGRKIAPELIQNTFNTDAILQALTPLLHSEPAWQQQATALAEVRTKLAQDHAPAAHAAAEVLALI